MIVVGIDPGAKHVGVCLRDGATVLGFGVLDGDSFHDLPFFFNRLRSFVDSQIMNHVMNVVGADDVVVAVEGVQPPNVWHNGRKQMLPVDSLIGTAMMFGAVLATWPTAIVVPPGKNGSSPINTYPTELVGPREGKAGTGRLRHARSAWDVAGSAPKIARLVAS